MTKLFLPLSAALLLLPLTATAAPAPSHVNDEGATVKDNDTYREIIFDKDDNVDGEVFAPGGVNVPGARAQEHASMIGIRGEFIPHLIMLSNDI